MALNLKEVFAPAAIAAYWTNDPTNAMPFASDALFPAKKKAGLDLKWLRGHKGVGINVIKDEHVMIDILYDGVKPARKRWLAIVNYLIVLAVVLVFTYQGFKYVGVAGKQISQGMEIPMMYMYGIMPVCGIICAICVVIKIITLYKADISYFAPKNQALSRDDA